MTQCMDGGVGDWSSTRNGKNSYSEYVQEIDYGWEMGEMIRVKENFLENKRVDDDEERGG